MLLSRLDEVCAPAEDGGGGFFCEPGPCAQDLVARSTWMACVTRVSSVRGLHGFDKTLWLWTLCHKALDVPTFLSPVSAETDITYTGRSITANSCICHHKKDGCVVDPVHGFDTIRHVHSSRKNGSGFRTLVPSLANMRCTLTANETLYELQYSHSFERKMPQRIPPSLAS